MKIKVRLHNKNCFPEVYGNLIDLKSNADYSFSEPYLVKDSMREQLIIDSKTIPLGITIMLPKFFRLNLISRSSMWFKYNLIVGNGIGIIDGDTNLSKRIRGICVNTKADKGYNGERDVLGIKFAALGKANIKEGERVAQIEILPTMDCPWYVWLKWIFNRKIKIEYIDCINNENRGGFGSTNK